VQDCYAVMEWLVDNATEQGIDPERIALGGASAGGGLAAATALLAHDRGRVLPAFQLLVYPMLDDRTVLRRDLDTTHARFWRPKSNRYAWSAYLGAEAGGDDVSDYAAPARRTDLSGLPPAWIGVGTLDLFHAEDVDYAHRLRRAGVPVDLVVIGRLPRVRRAVQEEAGIPSFLGSAAGCAPACFLRFEGPEIGSGHVDA
jgi:acetyl esterase/lipase